MMKRCIRPYFPSLLFLLLCLILVPAASEARLMAGVAQASLGVRIGVPNGGTADLVGLLKGPGGTFVDVFAPSEAEHQKLMAKVTALENDGTYLIFITVDAIGASDLMTIRTAEYIEKQTGLDLFENILFNGTHTHSGPGRMSEHILYNLAMDTFLQELFDGMVHHVGDAVIQALDEMVPAKIGHAYVEKDINGEWDVPYKEWIHGDRRGENDVLYGNDTLDHRLGVVRIDTADGEPLAAFINWAMHGTLVGPPDDAVISAECLGATVWNFERTFAKKYRKPVQAHYIQHAAGDVSPRGNHFGHTKFQAMEAIGKLLAPTVLQVYESIDPEQMSEDAAIRIQWARVPLSEEHIYENAGKYKNPDDSSFDYKYGAYGCGDDEIPLNMKDENECLALPDPDVAKYQVPSNALLQLAWYFLVDSCTRVETIVPQTARIMAVELGDILIVTGPGEPLTSWWWELLSDVKMVSGKSEEDIFLWGFTADHTGYISEPRDFDQGGYEAGMNFWGRLYGAYLRFNIVEVVRALKTGDDSDLVREDYEVEDYDYTPVGSTVSRNAETVIIEPRAEIERFGTVHFRWRGGDPVNGTPSVILQEKVGGNWRDLQREDGLVYTNDGPEMFLHYERGTDCEHEWRVQWQTTYDDPVGTLRFKVYGDYFDGSETIEYELHSREFDLAPSSRLGVHDLNVASQGNNNYKISALLTYPAEPDGFRCIDPFAPVDEPSPVREGTMGFTVSSEVQPVIGEYNPETGRFEATCEIDPEAGPVAILVIAGNAEDGYANTNCNESLSVVVDAGVITPEQGETVSARISTPRNGEQFELEEEIPFRAQTSETIKGYQWDFGDGSKTCGTSVMHAFGEEGRFDVTLVTDNGNGLTSTKTVMVVIGEQRREEEEEEIECPTTTAQNDCFGSADDPSEVMCGHCGSLGTSSDIMEPGTVFLSAIFLLLPLFAIPLIRRAPCRGKR